jgi:methyl-accepting chemotaxis protein
MMRIRIVLPGIVSILALLLLVVATQAAFEALERRAESEAFVDVNGTASLLLKSAGDWAVERGLVNAALNAHDAVSAASRDEIQRRRSAADQALRDALHSLKKFPQMRNGQQAIGDAERAFAAAQEIRSEADQAIGKGVSERRPETSEAWVPTITSLIDAVSRLRLTLETLTRAPAAQLVQLINLRHLAAEMAEHAGRERARLVATVGNRRKLTESELRAISEARGHVDLAWNAIAVLRAREDISQKLNAAIDAVERDYFGAYGDLRKRVLAAASTGDYPVDGKQYFEQVTVGINTMLRLAQEMGTAADGAALRGASDSARGAVFAAALLAAGLALAGLSFWVAMRRIVQPIAGMTAAMSRLATGDTTVEIVGAGRNDELGAMAAAVQVFKDNAIAMAKLQAEQEELKRQAELEKQRALKKLTDEFEASVAGVVSIVSSAANEMQSTAQSMSATAEETSQQAVTVASAAEQASANVQTVASAAEELLSSIAEIGRRVTQASGIAGSAASDGRRTDVIVRGLADEAQKIGEVIKLIQDVAGRTNLLALNATIEAARAGEAGKGFAVVASEVKNLANQTAKATDEIRARIAAIQSQTSAAVEAIRGICGTIEEINGISSSIAAAVEEQSTATREISRSVQQAATGTAQVSDNIGGVSTAADNTGAAASQVLGSASELAKQSEILRSEVENFLTRVRAA